MKKGKGEEQSRAEWPPGCSEENRVRNMRPPPGAGSGDVKGKNEKEEKGKKYKRARGIRENRGMKNKEDRRII